MVIFRILTNSTLIMKLLNSSLIFLLLILSFVTSSLFAQDKSDIVYMLNGETKEGKVTGIHENTIEVPPFVRAA